MANFKDRKLTIPDKNKYRHLRQYANMTDDEYEIAWEKIVSGAVTNKAFEKRIEERTERFGEDYDLEDLKINDSLTLRSLIQAYITLDDLEIFQYNLRSGKLEMETIFTLEKVNSIMSKLRDDISKMQDDLKITRKIRKGDKEESVIAYIEKVKQKAKEFYKSRMSYIFCPKCSMLLGTVWFQYPDTSKNKLRFVCERLLETGDKCGTVVNVDSSELMEKNGANIDNIPDSFK